MTQEFFRTQIKRLQTRFGERAFDDEFVKLAWEEAREISEPWFKRAVDIWIGSRPAHLAPMLAEFREARLEETKQSLRTEASQIARTLGIQRKTIGELLGPSFGAVGTALEALKAAKVKIRRERAGS